jgi:hypothetical protein
VADCRNSGAHFTTAEGVNQRHQDPGARAADRVTQGDGAAVDVELFDGHIEPSREQNTIDGESFVVFEQIEVADRLALPFQELLDRRDRRLGEAVRLAGCPGRSRDPGQRLQTMLFDRPFRSQDQSGGTV